MKEGPFGANHPNPPAYPPSGPGQPPLPAYAVVGAGPSLYVPVDEHGRALDPRTGRPRLTSKEITGLVLAALLALVTIGACGFLGLLAMMTTDGCNALKPDCDAIVTDAVLFSTVAQLALTIGAIVVLVMTRWPTPRRIGLLCTIAALSVTSLVITFAWAGTGPGSGV